MAKTHLQPDPDSIEFQLKDMSPDEQDLVLSEHVLLEFPPQGLHQRGVETNCDGVERDPAYPEGWNS